MKIPDFLQELFLEEAWKNVDKIDGFIESKANAEEFEVTAEEVKQPVPHDAQHQGSAAMMGYPAISETAHAAEDLFSYLREESAPAQKDLQSILQLLRMVSGFLKRELRRLETDDEVTDFGWAVVRRIKNFLSQWIVRMSRRAQAIRLPIPEREKSGFPIRILRHFFRRWIVWQR